MPFARFTYHLAPTSPRIDTQALAEALTDLIARDLGKRRDLTSVLIETPTAACWAIGGGRQAVAAHLEVFVTSGTNTTEEKREFLAQAMALMRANIPDLHPATYVVVHELPSTDWGYDGVSQFDRAAGLPL
ncbi:MAG: tautomerase family protein [Rhizobium sp.]|nr:tautomerase family protein [Rhizobium sp.]